MISNSPSVGAKTLVKFKVLSRVLKRLEKGAQLRVGRVMQREGGNVELIGCLRETFKKEDNHQNHHDRNNHFHHNHVSHHNHDAKGRKECRTDRLCAGNI